MKDPAFLFYPSDFLTGTMAMPFDERGRYITLLCFQHQSGRMTEETIRFLVGSFSDMLRLKFSRDENGLFYNSRLEDEIKKRTDFLESRRNNGRLGGRPKKENNLDETYNKPRLKPKQKLGEDVNENENKVVVFDNTMVVFENFVRQCRKKFFNFIWIILLYEVFILDFKTILLAFIFLSEIFKNYHCIIKNNNFIFIFIYIFT